MGTPDFAVPFLDKLLKSDQDVVGVYTKKAKIRERGQKLGNTPVYNLAAFWGVPIFTPGSFRGGKNLEDLKMLAPDLVVVVAYGLLLPRELLEIPKYGCLNIHPSLLPRWRGCAPMERCLMSDDDETGVCLIKVDEGLDSGDIVSSRKVAIAMDTDIASLRHRLANLGVNMLMEALETLDRNKQISGTKQDGALATFSEKITSEDALIDWQNDGARKIHRKIMALGDSVGVHLKHGGNGLKLIKSSYSLLSGGAGEVARIVDKNFSIACRDGLLEIIELQKEGKKPLSLRDFLNGYKFSVGDPVR
jgi:methionyl-tRNA formyltransferase